MFYWTGDIPSAPLTVDPWRAGEAVDLAPFSSAEATLHDPDGNPVGQFTATLNKDTEEVVIGWPATSPFAEAGVYQFRLVLIGTGARETISPARLVVQNSDAWLTLEDARADWRDAPADDVQLFRLLDVARVQCIDYADDFTGRPPHHFLTAQAMQTRNLWNAAKTDPSGDMGAEGFVIRPFPMDWTVKNILRPKNTTPVVG